MQLHTLAWYGRHHAAGDVARMVRWGPGAPRYAELTWVNPRQCDRLYEGWHRYHSAQVVDGDWDLEVTPFEDDPKMRACRQHFQHGIAWENTGIYEYILTQISRRGGRYDGCESLEDVIARYRRLDTIFTRVQEEGQLRSSSSLGAPFRETGGVLIHFDRHGTPIFSGRGAHRLAMARVLELRSIPAVVGVVHRRAVTRWRRPTAELPTPDQESTQTDQ